jgi:hypothetical protein
MKLLLLLALAGKFHGENVGPLGWTTDGRYFVWGQSNVTAEGGPYIALDTKTGTTVSLGEESAFEDWTNSHPLADLARHRASPDGKATANVKLLGGNGTGAWKDATWSPASASATELRVERDGQSWVSVSWSGTVKYVQPCWSPTGRQVAWLVTTTDWEEMGVGLPWHVIIGPGGYPRVHVVAEKALLDKVAPAVRDALDAKGLFTTYVGKAKKARDASVVYAAKGQEALAQKAAALIPGGATVDKLTWSVDADLVVALGKSAGGAK